MITAQMALNAAMAVPPGTEAHRIAAEICAMRGIQPEGFGNGKGMENWRVEIAECLLRRHLDAVLPPL